jgi:hypothetical protein
MCKNNRKILRFLQERQKKAFRGLILTLIKIAYMYFYVLFLYRKLKFTICYIAFYKMYNFLKALCLPNYIMLIE